MTGFVRCGECGIRYGGRHEYCPRCGESNPIEVPAPQPASMGPGQGPSPRSAVAIVVLGGLALAAAAAFWASRGPLAPVARIEAAPSPLARIFKGEPPRRSTAAPVAANIPALDPPAAGRVEYHGGNYEAALAHFRGRLEQNPDDAESLSNAGQVLVRLGRPAEALPLLSRAAELDPARWAYRFNLARAEGLLGQWERAAEDYVAAEGLFPNDYATIFNRAQALHMLGREQDAAAQYRRAIELKPDDPTFYLALGMSEEKLGRRAEAAAAYRRFLSLSPSDPQSEKVEARAKALESPAPAAPPRSPTTLTASAIPGAD